MPVLTQKETQIMTGKIPSTAEQRYSINLKLKAWQAKITDPEYISAINALVPIALTNTKKIWSEHRILFMNGKGPSWNKIYIDEVNRLAAELGLRAKR